MTGTVVIRAENQKRNENEIHVVNGSAPNGAIGEAEEGVDTGDEIGGWKYSGNKVNEENDSDNAEQTICTNGHAKHTANSVHDGNAVDEAKLRLLRFIENDVIGDGAVFEGPYGSRRILYTDYVASGKALNSIEQFVIKHILPTYGNTHTHSTVTSAQTSRFRDDAKEIIRKAFNTNDDDVVIFTGSGVTGAVHKLIEVMDLQTPPVVFSGPFEHHSNLLPWREMESDVVNIGEDADGRVDLRHLEAALRVWSRSGRPLIGSFNAASNITGITTETRKMAALLHKYGAISLWDYATGAPYLDINMHPKPLDGYDTSKDAVFVSMHKFTGSPDAPGLLVASKHLFRRKVPSIPGGGTVLFVSKNGHQYLNNIESREEGGTPAIIGSIRAGIAIKLKMSVGSDVIMARETELYNRAMAVWRDIPELEILGMLEGRQAVEKGEHKLAVFSFLIRHKDTGLYLHYNFVTTLLNDLFGIQTRGGCSCAGVYAQHLLGIDSEGEDRFSDVLVKESENDKMRTGQETERTEYEVLRPGFTRLNFAYFISDEDADFIISAVAKVARQGWTLLPQYEFSSTEGSWGHNNFAEESERVCLGDIEFLQDGLHFFCDTKYRPSPLGLPTSRADCLRKADMIISNAMMIRGKNVQDQRVHFSDPDVTDLRWFLLPYEAQQILRGNAVPKNENPAFEVRKKIRELTEDEITKEIISTVNEANERENDEVNGAWTCRDGASAGKKKSKKYRQPVCCKPKPRPSPPK